MIKINDRISWLEAVKEPLSGDVGIVQGDSCTWIYDVGCNEEAYEVISGIEGKKNGVISHFHPDHMGNLKRLEFQKLYVGKQTYQHAKCGQIVEESICLEDGCRIRILPIPTSHAKGCLGMEVDEKYLFLGDAFYPAYKEKQSIYNVQLLAELIRTLEASKARYLVVSHRKRPVLEKSQGIQFLKKIYECRKKNKPDIIIPWER